MGDRVAVSRREGLGGVRHDNGGGGAKGALNPGAFGRTFGRERSSTLNTGGRPACFPVLFFLVCQSALLRLAPPRSACPADLDRCPRISRPPGSLHPQQGSGWQHLAASVQPARPPAVRRAGLRCLLRAAEPGGRATHAPHTHAPCMTPPGERGRPCRTARADPHPRPAWCPQARPQHSALARHPRPAHPRPPAACLVAWAAAPAQAASAAPVQADSALVGGTGAGRWALGTPPHPARRRAPTPSRQPA
jgi:hypothetical protein